MKFFIKLLFKTLWRNQPIKFCRFCWKFRKMNHHQRCCTCGKYMESPSYGCPRCYRDDKVDDDTMINYESFTKSVSSIGGCYIYFKEGENYGKETHKCPWCGTIFNICI